MHYVVRHGRRIAVETINTGIAPKQKIHREAHIGCPVKWLKRVLPVVRSKQELAVAQWLWRRRTVCGGEWFSVPNETLYKELGLDRQVKYRTLKRLKKAGIIDTVHDGKQAIRVRIIR